MGRFDSGVSGFIKGRATIEVNFPVDWKGRAGNRKFEKRHL
jgi:hypothetical protein